MLAGLLEDECLDFLEREQHCRERDQHVEQLRGPRERVTFKGTFSRSGPNEVANVAREEGWSQRPGVLVQVSRRRLGRTVG